MNNIGESLKTYRKAKRITQKELANISGVSETSIVKYENNTRTPKIDTLKKLAPALGVTYDELMEKAGYIKTYTDSKEITEKFLDTIRASLNDAGITLGNVDVDNAVEEIASKMGTSKKEVYANIISSVIDKVVFNEEENALKVYYLNSIEEQISTDNSKDNTIMFPNLKLVQEDKNFFETYNKLNERNKGKAELYIEQLLKEQDERK